MSFSNLIRETTLTTPRYVKDHRWLNLPPVINLTRARLDSRDQIPERDDPGYMDTAKLSATQRMREGTEKQEQGREKALGQDKETSCRYNAAAGEGDPRAVGVRYGST